MKRKLSFRLILVGVSVLSTDASLAESGWSVSAGLQTRQVNVGFQLAAPSAISAAGAYSLRRAAGLGDVGVATSGTQFLRYEDGTVGVDLSFFKRGDTSFSVSSASQVVFGDQPPGADFATPGTVTFHSSGIAYEYATLFSATPYEGEDNEVVLSPFIELRRELFRNDRLSAGVSVGWSWLQSSHSSGWQNVASLAVVETATRTNYTYVYDLPASAGGAPTGFPPVYDNTSSTGVIVDPDAYNSFGGFSPGDDEFVRSARTLRNGRSSDRLIVLLQARSRADLKLNAQVLPMLADIRWQAAPRMALSLLAGPTLNVIHHRLNSRTDWLLNGRRFASSEASDSGTRLTVGGTLRALVSVALSQDGRWSFEAGGGYDWVPAHTVSAGHATAKIDLSSWVGSAGFRYVF
ncbi:MAG: hypothetical protein KDK97_06385 [Verrucomicrobiales bacterium]|nr:hypothetical protein [Verrucomicrobiales bacterium]MCP5560011.1 hypothetical protein [Verrucomicrobiaceae bacterium]